MTLSSPRSCFSRKMFNVQFWVHRLSVTYVSSNIFIFYIFRVTQDFSDTLHILFCKCCRYSHHGWDVIWIHKYEYCFRYSRAEYRLGIGKFRLPSCLNSQPSVYISEKSCHKFWLNSKLSRVSVFNSSDTIEHVDKVCCLCCCVLHALSSQNSFQIVIYTPLLSELIKIPSSLVFDFYRYPIFDRRIARALKLSLCLVTIS